MMFDFTAPKPDFASADKKTYPSRLEDRGSTIHLYLSFVALLALLVVSKLLLLLVRMVNIKLKYIFVQLTAFKYE